MPPRQRTSTGVEVPSSPARETPVESRIRVTHVEPGDVIVVYLASHLSTDAYNVIRQEIQQSFRGCSVAIVAPGVQLSVMRIHGRIEEVRQVDDVSQWPERRATDPPPDHPRCLSDLGPQPEPARPSRRFRFRRSG